MGDNLATALFMYKLVVDTYRHNVFSWRCASHVHMNLLDMDIADIAPLAVITFAADNYFYALGAETRRDNYNCRPLSLLIPTAEMLGTICAASLAEDADNLRLVVTATSENPEDRYSGMNWWALGRFGTLEVRHFPGTADIDLLTGWILRCADMYTAAETMTYDEVIGLIQQGPDSFGGAVFGPRWTGMTYAGHERDWADMLDGLAHLRTVCDFSFEDEPSLDTILRQQKVLN